MRRTPGLTLDRGFSDSSREVLRLGSQGMGDFGGKTWYLPQLITYSRRSSFNVSENDISYGGIRHEVY